MTQAETEQAKTQDAATGVDPVRIGRTLPARPGLVWRAFTDPNALTSWFWPARLAPRVQADPRVGGRYRIASAVARSVSTAVSGEYLTVEEPTTLAFTWCWEGGEATSRVTVRLAEADAGTELTIEHGGFADEEDRDAQARGWRDCLDRLPTWLLEVAAPS